MGPGRDQTRDPWICSKTGICCQAHHRLRYAAQSYQQVSHCFDIVLTHFLYNPVFFIFFRRHEARTTETKVVNETLNSLQSGVVILENKRSRVRVISTNNTVNKEIKMRCFFFTLKAPPIFCSRRQFKILLLFQNNK